VTIGFALAPEHAAELDKIQAEHMADPPSGRVPSKPHRYERFVEPAVTTVSVKALRANPLAASASAPDPDRESRDVAGKLKAFADAVAARFKPGDPVSIADAAEAAGVTTATAYDRIGRLKKRGASPDGWPYAPGVNGQRKAGTAEPDRPKTPRGDGRRVGSPRLDGIDLSAEAVESPRRATPEPTPEAPAEVAKPATVELTPAPAASTPIGGDLAATAARLREAAELIERAAAILKGGAA